MTCFAASEATTSRAPDRAATDGTQPAPGPAPAGVDPNADVKTLRDDLTSLRSDLRRWGTAVGTIATALLAGVGWGQRAKLFPLPGPMWVPWVAGLCTLAAVGGSVSIFVRLYRAQSRILMGTEGELPGNPGLSKGEVDLAMLFLARQARMQNALLLRDVDARAQRLDRIATELELTTPTAPLAQAARKEADRLNTYVGVAEYRICVAILERRSRAAISGWSTAAALLVCALGIAGIFATANYSDGVRQANKPASSKAALDCLSSVDQAKLGPALTAKLHAACTKLIAP